MLDNCDVHDAAPMMSERDQDEQQPHVAVGTTKKSAGDQLVRMVGQERPPGLRGMAVADHVRGDRCLRDGDSSFSSSP